MTPGYYGECSKFLAMFFPIKNLTLRQPSVSLRFKLIQTLQKKDFSVARAKIFFFSIQLLSSQAACLEADRACDALEAVEDHSAPSRASIKVSII